MRWLILFGILAVVIWLLLRKRDSHASRPQKRIRHGRGEGGADRDFGDGSDSGGSDGGGDGGGD